LKTPNAPFQTNLQFTGDPTNFIPPSAPCGIFLKNIKPPKYQNQQSSPSETMTDRKKIEHRAYELFVERGSTPGCDLEDWLQAEEEFKSPGQAAMSR
jgi:hypothetical protein